jgi:methylmalonyl-CoA/ethylmalonyl-CoA epimerase
MVEITKFDHVAIAVRDLPRAVNLFIDVLGGTFIGGGDNPELEVRAIQVSFPPGFRIELLTPLTPTSYLARYLERSGEGFHHVTAYVTDVQEAADTLESAGFATVDTRTDRDSWQETFIRPTSAFGALVQLATPGAPWSEPLDGITVTDVLEGRVQVIANAVTWKETGEPILPGPAADTPGA